MKHVGILSIFVFVFAAVGCKKETKTIAINSELKAAFNYQPGTYWIYRDSVSGSIDSFFYADRMEGGTTYSNGLIDVLSLGIIIRQNNLDPLPVQKGTATWQYTMEDDRLSLYFSKIDSAGLVFGSADIEPVLNYPYKDPIVSYNKSWTFEDVPSIQKMDSYTINGFTFNNVAIANHRNAAGTVNYTFYFSPEVGFFKIRIYDPAKSMDNVWELVRYNIVK